MKSLPQFQEYSKVLWDYLPDMSSYMPSAEDRNLVLDRSRTKGQEHRIRIWDYFFRPRPKDVGIRLQAEIAKLETEIAQKTAEATSRLEAECQRILDLEAERERGRRSIGESLQQVAKEITEKEQREGNWKLATGGVLAGASLAAAAYLYSTNAGCLWALYVIAGIPVFIVGVIRLVAGLQQLHPDNIAKKVQAAQRDLHEQLKSLERRIKDALEAAEAACLDPRWVLDKLIPHLRARLELVQTDLRALIHQIPDPPSPDEVEGWLQQDLSQLVEIGAEHLGIVLADLKPKIFDGPNPLSLLGPAELQGSGDIPPVCYKGGRERYLKARRITRNPRGQRFQHYGIFCTELLYISEPTLGRYSVYFDFIRGDALNERAPLQHYADVVILEIRREFREVNIDDKTIEILHAPSLHLALKSGDRISITLPNDEYFAAAGLENSAASDTDYDASKTADRAARAIREKVDKSKKNLEISELARLERERRERERGGEEPASG